MSYELAVGLAILVLTALAAWLLARRSQSVGRKKEKSCPHCAAQIPLSSSVCPKCSEELLSCPTCGAVLHHGEASCEVCGERLSKPPPPACTCPRCGRSVERSSRKCPACGEEFWSPILKSR